MLKLLAWFVERAMEFVGACLLVLKVYGPANYPGYEGWSGEFVFAGIFVCFFYMITGYVFTSLALGWFGRIGFGWARPWFIAGLFLLHFGLLCLFSGGAPEHGFALAAGGLAVAASASTLTVLIFRRWT